ncbi:hypothetical protein GOBAR_AA36258 [Gossypium barbadense]|uniref:Uncharacterized protein n=1 Tax=Gossypium barbadense TaxID=3634 RepID=A0A2P5W061_GOSBA|nr:hypothetical protein GOBAR_AA36258 [Gossypium barbadense]
MFFGRIDAHGRVARPRSASFASPTPIFTHGHLGRPWQLIDSRVGEKFYPVFTRSYRTAVLPSVVWARPKARLWARPCGSRKPVFSVSAYFSFGILLD